MAKNPYQSPQAAPPETPKPRHSSFRLSQEGSSPPSSEATGTLRSVIFFAALQQVPVLLLAALLLDGGGIFRRVAIASLVFWICTLLLMVRRGANTSRVDRLLVKWGYWPILLVVNIAGSVGAVMK